MSRRRASVTPYAKALIDVAVAEKRAEAIGEELGTIASLVTGHPELSSLVGNPAIPTKIKRGVIDRLADSAGLSAPLRRLLSLLADRDRLSLLPQLHEAYQGRLMQHLGVVETHVTTAIPLSPDKARAIADGLERATGKHVRLTTAIDPGIMGGVVARMGSTVYDGSVARQLERIRERLSSESA